MAVTKEELIREYTRAIQEGIVNKLEKRNK